MKHNTQIRNFTLDPDSVDTEKRTATFVISSESVDTYNTVFLSEGWDLTRYNNNPIVSYNHNAFHDDPDIAVIGTSRVYKEGKRLLAELYFEEDNPMADKVMRKVKNGTLRMASINADISEYRRGKRDANEDPEVIYFTRQSLEEWSVVTIGSNSDALKRSKECLKQMRSTAAKDIETDSEEITAGADDASEEGEEKRALDAFEAQLIVNQNRLVK